MKFKLEIDCDSEVLTADPVYEVCRILGKMAWEGNLLEPSMGPTELFDDNGNRVGEMRFSE